MKRQYLTINQAAQRLGVSAKTLRRWEEKGILVPKRSIGNQRRYLLSDIEKREKKAFTINEAAARLFVSANTLRRWEAKGIITPKRSLGNQRFYTLADVQKLEAMHYPTVDKEETTTIEQAPNTIAQTTLPVIARSEERTTKQSLPAGMQVNNNEIATLSGEAGFARNDKEENNTDKPRFFDLGSVDKPEEKPTETPIPPQPPNIPFTPSPAFHGIPKPIHADREQTYNENYKQKPSIPWHIAKPPTHWAVGLSSFLSVILILTLLTKAGATAYLISLIPYSNDSKNVKISSGEEVLQSATERRDYAFRINVPVEMLQTASIAGNLTAPNILYSVLPGDNITISGDPQNPVISATVEDLEDFGFVSGDGIAFDGATITNDDPGSAQNIFKNIKVGSDTISAGSNTDTLELAAGSNVTLTTDTSNKKITISASGGSSGGISGIAVLEGDTTVSDDINTLDFLGGDFDVGESPSGEANIQLASTLTSVTGVSGNFSIGGTTTLNGLTYTWPGSEGADYILQTDGAGSLTWIDSSSLPDIGDVVGPGSSTDHALVRFNGTNGTSIQNSGVIVDDSDNVTGVNALTVAPASDTTALTLTGTNTTSQSLAYFNAHNASGTIVDISYGGTQTLTGSLIGQLIDLNNGQVTATNQDVTGQRVTLPTVTNTNAAGTVNLRGLQVNFGSGAGINQNGAGATIFSNLDVQLPALTQTQGSLTANGLAVTLPSSITTGGVANGLLISPTGVGAGTLHGVNIATISASGNGNETAIHVGSGWDTVLRVNGTPVINGQGVTLATGGGTGQSTYAVGDILYADGTGTLTRLPISNTDDYVLKVSSGVPIWGTVAGDSCSSCVITDPSSSATNTITPTGQATTGLIVRQTSTASPTNDIFQVTDSTGANVYFRIDENGNVYPSSAIGDTLTLTPNNDTTALTLVGTNVITQPLAYLNTNNQEGNILNLNYGASQTLSTTTPLNAIAVDLSTNVTATNANVTGTNLTLPGATNTHTSGLKEITGVSVTAGGGINQNGAGGTTTFAAFEATIPALTQTDGTLNGYGLTVTTPSSITTGGTAAALNVSASGVGAGTLYGLNVGSITAGAGIETALNIGTGWDTILALNGTPLIDGSGNFNLTNATGVLPVENGGSPFEQAAGAIFPRIITQDLLLGGIATDSASFHVFGSANGSTTPVASVSGNTSDTAFIVDNRGSGDLFRANSSGGNRFIITQAGNVGINTTSPTGILDIQQGTNLSSFFRRSSGQYLELRTNATGNSLLGFSDSGNAKNLAFGIDANSAGFSWHTGVTTTGQGTTEMFLSTIGTLGIGTTAPTASLHVAAQTATFPMILASGSTNAGFPTLVINQTGSGDIFVASDSGTNVFIIGNGGNVGIGTTTLQETLNIAGNIDLNSGELYLNNTAGTVYGFGYAVEGGSEATIFVDQFLDFTESDGDSIVMRLDANNGRLGIGTTGIDEAFEVNGNIFLSGTGRSVWIGNNADSGNALRLHNSGSASYIDYTGGGLHFRSGSTDRIIFTAAGRLGIGVTSPNVPLDVRGSVSNDFSGGYWYIEPDGDQGTFDGANPYTAYFENFIRTGEVHIYSDQRLKDFYDNLNPDLALDRINQLRPLYYQWKEETNRGPMIIPGFFAQEVENLLPGAVLVSQGQYYADERVLDFNALTTYAIAGIQSLNNKVDASNAALFRNLTLTPSGDLNVTANSIQAQTLTLGGTNLNDRLVGLESGFASASAGFATPLTTQIASLSSQFTNLSSKVASMEAQLQLLSANSQLLTGFTASSGAELALESLEVNGQILADSLSVLGYTTMNELSVTGSIRTGVLTIKGQSNGGASISTLNGDLRLQDQGFGGIDILDGLVTIDTSGNLETKGTITARKLNIDESNTLSASVGQGTIPLNGTNALIYTTAVTSDSHIFVTPRTKTNQQLSVTTQVSGGYFKVEITSPAPQPIKFDWWIVN